MQLWSSGAFPQEGKYNTCDFIVVLLYFFSVTRPGRTVAPILTLNGSNDVFPPKDGPFGSHDDWRRHMGKIWRAFITRMHSSAKLQ